MEGPLPLIPPSQSLRSYHSLPCALSSGSTDIAALFLHILCFLLVAFCHIVASTWGSFFLYPMFILSHTHLTISCRKLSLALSSYPSRVKLSILDSEGSLLFEKCTYLLHWNGLFIYSYIPWNLVLPENICHVLFTYETSSASKVPGT